MNILISGGAGFLGSHLADTLAEAGYKVTIYDRVASPYLKESQRQVVADVLNRQRLFHELKHIDTVVHMAALADMDKAWNNPRETIKINVLGTMNVLEACRLNGVRKFVFASSIYADSDSKWLYGVSKQIGELLVKSYHRYCNMQYAILRFGTLYGTRATGDNSIHRLLQMALKQGKLEYKGTGDEVREYIHVRDAVAMCMKLLEKPLGNETLMLTGYQRISLKEVLDIIAEMLNLPKASYSQKKSLAHYKQVSARYVPDTVKRIIPTRSEDFGLALREIAEEINESKR